MNDGDNPDPARCDPTASGPVQYLPSDYGAPPPRPGIGLCLSGGGYRAMLFHLGALIRLNEAGLLAKLKRISSVSGGSIAAAVLGLKWKRLGFVTGVAVNLREEVVEPVRTMAGKTIDVEAIIEGLLLPGSVSERLEQAYDYRLFGGATLQDLPSDEEGPRIVINATSVQSGALFRFSRPFMADYRVGQVKSPRVSLAKAVAASSAFPPVLSPCVVRANPADFVPDPNCPLQRPPFTSEIVLSDGGVYDNLGLETVWKDYQTVLVSDGGGHLEPEEKPKHDWARHAYRVLELVDNQVRSLRKRQVIAAFKDPADRHDGTYWGIRSHVKDYRLATAIECPEDRTLALAQMPTRLKRLDPVLQERLINWGYAICDTAIRAHVDGTLPKSSLPYPNSPI